MSTRYGSPDERGSTQSRFWAKVAVVHDLHSCWLWSGLRDKHGYGRLNENGKPILVHRYAYKLMIGRIRSGLYVCHCCDVPLCVRPSHLFLGTQKQNLRDASAKGRMASGERNGHYTHPERFARGERHGWTILTSAAVLEIRRLWSIEPHPPRRVLAHQFGVSPGAIQGVVERRSWKHI